MSASEDEILGRILRRFLEGDHFRIVAPADASNEHVDAEDLHDGETRIRRFWFVLDATVYVDAAERDLLAKIDAMRRDDR